MAPGTLRHHNNKVALADALGVLHPLVNIALKIIRLFRHQNRHGADRDSGIQRNVSAAPAHHLNHTAAVVGFGCVAQAVYHLHRGVHRGVVTDGVLAARNIIIDGSRHADAGNPGLCQVARAAERTVAADDNQTLNAQLPAVFRRLLHALRRIELRAAGSVKHGSAVVNNVRNTAQVHFFHIAVQQAVIAPVYPKNTHSACERGSNNGTHRRVHSGCVAAACEYSDLLLPHLSDPPESK